ncbi:zinc-binding metallopeptidase family protein [Elongatibacter sediminis]|uniref:Zinc-binding metallopeptidase n=1 Tax=Elongatibacter sediminis TaxID=3119006 RepID=A0AAW9RCS0_9GAMM
MKIFYCQCGSRVFFENTACLTCGRELGFDSDALTMRSLAPPAGPAANPAMLIDVEGQARWRCGNHVEHGNCNWLVSDGTAERLCRSCRLNDMIPALSGPGNLQLWTRVEEAKRRLLYSLFSLGLPLVRRGGSGLRFRIMEDRRRNPGVYESFVATAHLEGTITINIAEADDATRHAVREQMQERYRTVLGHLRHESGHFYFSLLTADPDLLEACRKRFGDERQDYQASLEAHYHSGPPADWHEHYVSAYAAAHPAEDFAETFAHFLHIHDALESARMTGLTPQADVDASADDAGWIADWAALAVTLNEIGRSLGSDDAYPFVLTDPVKEKLVFMNRLVARQVSRQAG